MVTSLCPRGSGPPSPPPSHLHVTIIPLSGYSACASVSSHDMYICIAYICKFTIEKGSERVKLLLLPPLVKGGMKALQRKICMQPKLYTNKYTFEMRALLYKATRICTTFSAHAPSYFHSSSFVCIYIFLPSSSLHSSLLYILCTHFRISFDRNYTPFAPCRQRHVVPFFVFWAAAGVNVGYCSCMIIFFAHITSSCIILDSSYLISVIYHPTCCVATMITFLNTYVSTKHFIHNHPLLCIRLVPIVWSDHSANTMLSILYEKANHVGSRSLLFVFIKAYYTR